MAIVYSTADVARKLGIKAKQLRKHLRKNWTKVGIGNRYMFDDEDVKKLAKELNVQLDHFVDLPGFPVETIMKSRTDPRTRAQVLAERKARQERLQKMIKESKS